MKSILKTKRLFAVVLALVMVSGLAGCSCSTSDNSNANSTQNASANASGTQNATATTPTTDGSKTLVVYFSWSGNVDKMANWVAEATGGKLVRVTPKTPYSTNYNETVDVAKKEQNDNARPEINVDLTAEQLSGYDTIYFGFPVWWGDIPQCMKTFLESYDFNGKTIIPFFSHEGTSSGGSSLDSIEKLAKGATVKKSDYLSIRGGKVADSKQEVVDWVAKVSK